MIICSTHISSSTHVMLEHAAIQYIYAHTHTEVEIENIFLVHCSMQGTKGKDDANTRSGYTTHAVLCDCRHKHI